MIILKEEFKAFIKTKPELVSYVTRGEMTWQRFYEIYNIYGTDEKVWSKYNEKEEASEKKTPESFSFSSIVDSIKKVDMDSVQKGIGSMQKAIELLQGLTAGGAAKGASDAASKYQPRQLFKKFED